MKKVKNSLIYPERVIERSLGKVPVSKELLDIHNRKRSSTFKFFLYITGFFSIIGIVGLINLPVIKYSVDWWSTLHQPSSITLTSAPTIHHTMLVPLLIMLVGMIFYSLIIFLMKYKTELIKFKLNKNKNNR